MDQLIDDFARLTTNFPGADQQVVIFREARHRAATRAATSVPTTINP